MVSSGSQQTLDQQNNLRERLAHKRQQVHLQTDEKTPRNDVQKLSGIAQLDVDSKIDMNSIRIRKVKGDMAVSGVQPVKKPFDSSLEPKLQTPDDIMLQHHMQKERLSLPLVNYPQNNNSPRN